MTSLRTESPSTLTTRYAGFKSIGRSTHNGSQRPRRVVEPFNDYKRRHPDEVFASRCRSQHSEHMSEFDRYNTLDYPDKGDELER